MYADAVHGHMLMKRPWFANSVKHLLAEGEGVME